uniref:Uncharacterized protein n=1 Tax=Anopheles atroparvus TaxID=41427 RepID=A0A182IWJ5_ANOAO
MIKFNLAPASDAAKGPLLRHAVSYAFGVHCLVTKGELHLILAVAFSCAVRSSKPSHRAAVGTSIWPLEVPRPDVPGGSSYRSWWCFSRAPIRQEIASTNQLPFLEGPEKFTQRRPVQPALAEHLLQDLLPGLRGAALHEFPMCERPAEELEEVGRPRPSVLGASFDRSIEGLINGSKANSEHAEGRRFASTINQGRDEGRRQRRIPPPYNQGTKTYVKEQQ